MDDKEHILQRKCNNLVHQHVYICQSSLVDEMLRREIFEYDDIEGLQQPKDESDLAYDYEDEWEKYKAAKDEKLATFRDYLILKEVSLGSDLSNYADDDLEELCPDELDDWNELLELRETLEEDLIYDFAEYLKEIENVDEWDLTEEVEIFEWWVVSDWLQHQLEERGEAFLKNDYGDWWGRSCSGQAIAIDSVIESIVKDYEAKYGESFNS